ncbi:PLP-dependent aminotransferase family protein [Hoyosella sp. YIM 151337]|uniref:MocR-like pyridoxine biosynthesis transcription factor PdxR n=1 Tax=Hoyosella sp. YIM 151337 TaxID=2992742 RepID=UPI002235938D|nr:PLP-dependent aminotransferase family protein [Hoyosella sp. YIM 151337]MCW4351852.1 PLP-dependent aminotransferase family protein [Hoyosella sp. YIM 151337]
MPVDLPIAIDRSSGTPLPAQVVSEVHRLCTAGVLKLGDKLPSTRGLADALRVSRNTVAAAYDQLIAEGWVVSKHGAGTFIDARSPQPPAPASRPVQAAGESETAQLIRLVPGAALPGGVAKAAWRRALRAAADTAAQPWPCDIALPEFADVVSQQLIRHRGYAQSEVFATAGTAAVIHELALAAGRCLRVGIENPGWQRVARILRRCGHEAIPIPADEDGATVPTGKLDAIVVTPGHQFPAGVRMSAPRRSQLVEWARRHEAWIVEDDYDGEIRYDSAPLPLLISLAPDRVIHLGSFSKILSPELSTGWLLAPASVMAVLRDHRVRTGFRPAVLGQRVIAALGVHGDLDRHLKRVRTELAWRRDALLRSLGAGRVTGASSGSHVVVPVPSRLAAPIAAKLERQGVLVHTLAHYWSGAGEPPGGLVLGYAGVSRDDLQRGLAAVKAALDFPNPPAYVNQNP